ncbi:carcinoembryonic antigen-related cell adhesion molecule 5-like [Heterodontus francisci]|uniref:carcinoembryonic antigen-related cell adhesion molecule 5-like n=1 Tax=Heterodontus francisci TaxID=7792 RepID=UPI00355B9DCE
MNWMKYFTFFMLLIGNSLVLSKGQSKPEIAMKPWLDGIVKGENVTITCTTTSACSQTWFSLYKSNAVKYHAKVRTIGTQCTVAFIIQVNKTEYYTCRYSAGSNNWKPSSYSDPVNITVIDRPKTPSISLMDHHPVFVKGERAEIKCQVSSKYSCSWLHLHRNGEEVGKKSVHSDDLHHTATYEIAPTDSESYSCLCVILLSGNWSESEHSDRINITVIANRPQKPEIRLNQSANIFLKGENVTIICAADIQNSSSRFSLYKVSNGDSADQRNSKTGYNFVSFDLVANVSEYYWCAYQTEISGCFVDSENSTTVHVPVIGRPTKPKISLNQNFTTVIRGELLLLTCKDPLQDSNNAFYLYEVINTIPVTTRIIVQGKQPVTLNLTNIMNLGEVLYRCIQKTVVSGRQIDSEQSDPVILTVVERPPKPEIRLNESVNIFLRGENVSITCAADFQHSSSTFSLYKVSNGHLVDQKNGNTGYNFVSFHIAAHVSEQYWCAYQTEISGRFIDSENGTTVKVPVIDRPTKPEIFLNQNFTTVIRGELLLLTCKAPPQDSNNALHLYEESNSFPVTAPIIMKGKYPVMFNLTDVMHLGQVHYRCIQKMLASGRQIDSERSDPVILTVIDRPLKPKVLLETQDPDNENEQNITVNCTAPNAYPIKEFFFYRNSQSLLQRVEVTKGQYSATISITVPRSNMSTAYYTCRYEVVLDGRRIGSDTSNRQRLVSDGFDMTLIILLGSAGFLFLIIIILASCVASTKRGARDSPYPLYRIILTVEMPQLDHYSIPHTQWNKRNDYAIYHSYLTLYVSVSF